MFRHKRGFVARIMISLSQKLHDAYYDVTGVLPTGAGAPLPAYETPFSTKSLTEKTRQAFHVGGYLHICGIRPLRHGTMSRRQRTQRLLCYWDYPDVQLRGLRGGALAREISMRQQRENAHQPSGQVRLMAPGLVELDGWEHAHERTARKVRMMGRGRIPACVRLAHECYSLFDFRELDEAHSNSRHTRILPQISDRTKVSARNLGDFQQSPSRRLMHQSQIWPPAVARRRRTICPPRQPITPIIKTGCRPRSISVQAGCCSASNEHYHGARKYGDDHRKSQSIKNRRTNHGQNSS